ncbi:hypothetical protein [Shewanella spartinae]|uniref:hypothetical protein n=1 Tax=Shewanella spartinae TaxID=2864205 RepID=UPI001C65D390|nr:hypothetical protein [Shewanella spartinae]QYJ93556.1 hypothetical protein K0I31_18570 [Shewanella spartinae]
MKFLFILTLPLFVACTGTQTYATFRAGSDSFSTLDNVFERSLCNGEQDTVQVKIHFDQRDGVEMLELAKEDITKGTIDSDEIEQICVSSYPFEVTIFNINSRTSISCFTLLDNEQSEFVTFVKSSPEVQSLPKSNCRYY